MISRIQKFYDNYHEKNRAYYKVISANNFTYFYILNFLQNHDVKICENSKLLDIGCGVGTLSLFFAHKGAEVHGLDISKRAISIANVAADSIGIKNVSFSSSKLKKGNNSYDVVICSEVLEHIENEEEFLALIFSHLKCGGTLFISVPSSENVLYKLGFYKKFDEEVGHLRRYNKTKLLSLLRRHGFETLATQEVEGPLRNLLFTTRLGAVIKIIKGPLVSIFHIADRLSALLFGASDIQVIAIKK